MIKEGNAILKRVLSIICFMTLCFSVSSALTADKVIVVPLGKTVNIDAPIAWQGQWQEGLEYYAGAGLQYLGSSYICIEPNTASIANAPPNSSFWSLMASEGPIGPQGIQGNVGPQGPQGPPGDNAMELQNVVTVSASGADFTDPIAAMNSITDASASNPYLLKIGPGIYDLGNNGLTMKPYVDIEGSGENVTIITSTHSNASRNDSFTIAGADHCELRFLTVENQGGSTYSSAIVNYHASPKISYVTAIASGVSSNTGIRTISSKTTMDKVTVTSSGGTGNSGVFAYESTVLMNNTTVTGSGGTNCTGVAVDDGIIIMNNVRVIATGGTGATGVAAGTSGEVTMNNVIVQVSNADNACGVCLPDGFSLIIRNTRISVVANQVAFGVKIPESYGRISDTEISVSGSTGTGVSSDNSNVKTTLKQVTINAPTTGLLANTIYPVYVHDSLITGTNTSIELDLTSIQDGQGVYVSNTMLEGAVNGGNFTCIGAYDSSFTALNSSCQ